ncbi:phospholipase A1-II 4-like [Corylus avellana]|uniref:phospholipase A1-II 4-like n=1 Tax=Corylus avellana TaxID=13451 RepID=UPI00286BF3CF|nr:phospholipase A1-II 4-like [Corylus avellana]
MDGARGYVVGSKTDEGTFFLPNKMATACAIIYLQVLSEVKRLVDHYKDEEVSITVVGYSLGAAMATLNAVDIVHNGINLKPSSNISEPINACLVTAFGFGVPRVGDKGFLQVFSDLENLHVLRINNRPGDIVPNHPSEWLSYVDVGEELIINTRKSPYLKVLPVESNEAKSKAHNLEVYLHGVAGTHGEDGDFKLEVNREIALVNKVSDALDDKLLVLDNWWITKNKSMVQNDDGSWVLMDRESDDNLI